MRIVQKNDFKLAGRTSGNLLAVRKTYTFALCGLCAEWALSLVNLTLHMNGNLARLNEN